MRKINIEWIGLRENISPILVTLGIFILIFLLRFTKAIALEVNATFFIYGSIALIVSGLLFWKRRYKIAIPIVLIVLLLGVFYLLDRAEDIPEQQAFEEQKIEINTTIFDASIDFYKGNLLVRQGEERFVTLTPEQDVKAPKLTAKERGIRTEVTLQREEHFFQEVDVESNWKVNLPTAVSGTLLAEVQDTQATIDLTDISTENITLKAKNSNVELILTPQQRKLEIDIEGGVLLLTTPENVVIDIEQEQSLIRNRAGLAQEGSKYSANADEEDRVNIKLVAKEATLVLE